MNAEQAMLTIVDALEAAQIPYLLVGSFSSNYYGIARSTKDVDVVVELGERSIREVVPHLPAEFQFDPQMRFETVTGTTRSIIRVAGTPFQIELFRLSADPHDQERFRRRRRVRLLHREVWLPTVEDVLVTKLNWLRIGGRGKDHDDLVSVIAVQRDAIDWDYVHQWCDRHGTRELLDEIRRSIPPI